MVVRNAYKSKGAKRGQASMTKMVQLRTKIRRIIDLNGMIPSGLICTIQTFINLLTSKDKQSRKRAAVMIVIHPPRTKIRLRNRGKLINTPKTKVMWSLMTVATAIFQ